MASVDNTQIHLETLRMNSIQTENSIQQIYSCQSIRNFPSFSFEKINPSSQHILADKRSDSYLHVYFFLLEDLGIFIEYCEESQDYFKVLVTQNLVQCKHVKFTSDQSFVGSNIKMAISGTSYNQTVPILREFLSLSPSFFFRLDVALDLEVDITRKYTGKYFFEEAQGLSDGSGVDLKVNMTFISILDIPTSYRNSKPRSSTLCCLFPVWSELSLYIECRDTVSEIYIQFICTSFMQQSELLVSFFVMFRSQCK